MAEQKARTSTASKQRASKGAHPNEDQGENTVFGALHLLSRGARNLDTAAAFRIGGSMLSERRDRFPEVKAGPAQGRTHPAEEMGNLRVGEAREWAAWQEPLVFDKGDAERLGRRRRAYRRKAAQEQTPTRADDLSSRRWRTLEPTRRPASR